MFHTVGVYWYGLSYYCLEFNFGREVKYRQYIINCEIIDTKIWKNVKLNRHRYVIERNKTQVSHYISLPVKGYILKYLQSEVEYKVYKYQNIPYIILDFSYWRDTLCYDLASEETFCLYTGSDNWKNVVSLSAVKYTKDRKIPSYFRHLIGYDRTNFDINFTYL